MLEATCAGPPLATVLVVLVRLAAAELLEAVVVPAVLKPALDPVLVNPIPGAADAGVEEVIPPKLSPVEEVLVEAAPKLKPGVVLAVDAATTPTDVLPAVRVLPRLKPPKAVGAALLLGAAVVAVGAPEEKLKPPVGRLEPKPSVGAFEASGVMEATGATLATGAAAVLEPNGVPMVKDPPPKPPNVEAPLDGLGAVVVLAPNAGKLDPEEIVILGVAPNPPNPTVAAVVAAGATVVAAPNPPNPPIDEAVVTAAGAAPDPKPPNPPVEAPNAGVAVVVVVAAPAPKPPNAEDAVDAGAPNPPKLPVVAPNAGAAVVVVVAAPKPPKAGAVVVAEAPSDPKLEPVAGAGAPNVCAAAPKPNEPVEGAAAPKAGAEDVGAPKLNEVVEAAAAVVAVAPNAGAAVFGVEAPKLNPPPPVPPPDPPNENAILTAELQIRS